MEETIFINGYEFKVDFDYQPYEHPTWDYPGADENVEVNGMYDYDGEEVKNYALELLEPYAQEEILHLIHKRRMEAREPDEISNNRLINWMRH